MDWKLCFIIFIVSGTTPVISQCRYRSNDEILRFMQEFSRRSFLNTRVFTIGRSVMNFPISVLQFNQPGNRLGVPNIKLIANIHGNEAVGREVLLHFAQFLESSYYTRPLVKCLVDNVRINIVPTMNPDGFDNSCKGDCVGIVGRHNRNNYDLNRNFPDYFSGNYYGVVQDDYRRIIQPETAAIMNWMNETKFVLSASLHGGAMVANYPFDNFGSPDDQNFKGEALTPDHDIVLHVAKTFVKEHKRMSKGLHCPQDEFGLFYFPDGLTNGARWYTLTGGMQDYNYIFHGCIEITLEISCCKYPDERRLPIFLKENMEPLLRFGLQALRGIKGRVLDSRNQMPIAGATLQIDGRKFTFRTNGRGEFWRLLMPGMYYLSVSAPGYQQYTEQVIVGNYPENECPRIPMRTISLIPKCCWQ